MARAPLRLHGAGQLLDELAAGRIKEMRLITGHRGGRMDEHYVDRCSMLNCLRTSGHLGRHYTWSAPATFRCSAQNSRGDQCVSSRGHDGAHSTPYDETRCIVWTVGMDDEIESEKAEAVPGFGVHSFAVDDVVQIRAQMRYGPVIQEAITDPAKVLGGGVTYMDDASGDLLNLSDWQVPEGANIAVVIWLKSE